MTGQMSGLLSGLYRISRVVNRMTVGDRNPIWNADGTDQMPLTKTSSFYTQ